MIFCSKQALLVAVFVAASSAYAQFSPPAGQPGSTAIHKDSSVFVGWATGCVVQRGPMDIAQPQLGSASAGIDSMAIGKVGLSGTVSLGDGGMATLTFATPITNGPGYDFAVFENAFSDSFLELAFVEVSSDGQRFVRFPSISLTQDSVQIGGFDLLDATKIHNFAGKYRVNYGVPFDLDEIKDSVGVDVNTITHVRIVDVVGSLSPLFGTKDYQGNFVNDPWPTPFPSSGFDLDGVGVIHQQGLTDSNLGRVTLNLQMYPLPATPNTKIVWQGSSASQGLLYLLDMQGSVVWETKVP
ncbi:MAG: hypothetical protein LAT76_12045, partial [Schleiferiaceae bacterium]|nr:hypothetical protein [Schleiferiaceae bacterium]